MDFSNYADTYDRGIAGKVSQKFYNLLVREVELTPGCAVLDVGCGTGTVLKMLADICPISGYGIDAEQNMIAAAKQQCPQIDFSVGRCDKTPFDDHSFDVVIACMAYHHFDNKEGFAIEAARLLKPGGVLYIADPRFPWLIRKTLNGVVRLFRIVGQFFSPQEIGARFSSAGFTGAGTAFDGYAQVVKLKKSAAPKEKS